VSSAIPAVTIITIFAQDIHNGTPDLTIIRTITAIGALGASWTAPALTVTTFARDLDPPRITVSITGGLNPAPPVVHTTDIGFPDPIIRINNGGLFFFDHRPQTVTSGEVVVRVTDDRDGITIFATLSLIIVDPPTISLGFVGAPDFRPALTETPTAVTIATLTMTGGLPYNPATTGASELLPISVSVVGGLHPSLSVVDMSIIVLSDASDEIAHTITVQAKNFPGLPARIAEPQLTISVTVVGFLQLLGGGAITLAHARPIEGTGERVLTLTATGGETANPTYLYRILNPNPLYNIIGVGSGGVLRGIIRLTGVTQNGSQVLPRQTQPHTLSVEVRENQAIGRVTAVVTINYVDPPVQLGGNNLDFATFTHNTLRAFTLSVSGGSGSGYSITLLSIALYEGIGGFIRDLQTRDYASSIDIRSAGKAVVSLRVDRAGTARVFFEAADDSQNNRATMSFDAGFVTTLSFFRIPGPRQIRGLQIFYTGSTYVDNYRIETFQLNDSGLNLSAEINGTQLDGGNSPQQECFDDTGGAFRCVNRHTDPMPAAQRARYRYVMSDGAYPDNSVANHFQQFITTTITVAILNATLSASLHAAAGPLNPAGYSTLGSVSLTAGLPEIGIDEVATIGVTNSNLTASIASDGGLFVDAPGGDFSVTLTYRDRHLGEQIHNIFLTVTGTIPIRRLNIGFSQTPNTIFLTLYRGTVGSITATEELSSAGTSTNNNAANNTNNTGFSNTPQQPPNFPAPPPPAKITTASTQPTKPTQPAKPPAVNSS
ncbi:MAG: hypothetical protein ACR2P4_08360, partial [Gammaproteobacteria bacterium]